jgi:hypothetical protein
MLAFVKGMSPFLGHCSTVILNNAFNAIVMRRGGGADKKEGG